MNLYRGCARAMQNFVKKTETKYSGFDEFARRFVESRANSHICRAHWQKNKRGKDEIYKIWFKIYHEQNFHTADSGALFCYFSERRDRSLYQYLYSYF
jgi:hypothetical protein